MNKRGVGAIFCFIAAILFATKYISAAIFMSGALSWDSELFQAGLGYVGSPLQVLSVISLIIGIIYLAYAEFEDRKKK